MLIIVIPCDGQPAPCLSPSKTFFSNAKMALPRRAALLVAVAMPCWVGVCAHEGQDVVEQLMAGGT